MLKINSLASSGKKKNNLTSFFQQFGEKCPFSKKKIGSQQLNSEMFFRLALLALGLNKMMHMLLSYFEYITISQSTSPNVKSMCKKMDLRRYHMIFEIFFLHMTIARSEDINKDDYICINMNRDFY